MAQRVPRAPASFGRCSPPPVIRLIHDLRFGAAGMEAGKWRSIAKFAPSSTLEARRPGGRMTWPIHDLRSGARGGLVQAKMALWPFAKAPFSASFDRLAHPDATWREKVGFASSKASAAHRASGVTADSNGSGPTLAGHAAWVPDARQHVLKNFPNYFVDSRLAPGDICSRASGSVTSSGRR
jgi:hypothetical protein